MSNAPRSNLAEVVHASWENMRESSLSLLDAAAFDTTQSFELDLQLMELEEGRPKGGTGPSAAKRVEKMRKQELEKAGKYADQIFQFSLPSSASVGKPSAAWSHVDPHDSHRADKRVSNDTNTNKAPNHTSQSRATKLRTKKSQVIQKRIETAKKEEEIIKVKECQDVPAGRKYVVKGSKSWLQKHPYEVLICTKPTCTCLDFNKAPNSGPCKHLIWLYLYIFHLKEDSHIIQQTSLTVDEVTKLLSVNDVENKYLAKKSTSASIVTKGGRFNFCKQLLQEDPRSSSYVFTWQLLEKQLKPGRNPSCPSCRGEIAPGDLAICVTALYVPYEQDFVQEKVFFFCPEIACVKILHFTQI